MQYCICKCLYSLATLCLQASVWKRPWSELGAATKVERSSRALILTRFWDTWTKTSPVSVMRSQGRSSRATSLTTTLLKMISLYGEVLLLFFTCDSYFFTKLATKVKEQVSNSVWTSNCFGFGSKPSSVEEVHLEADVSLLSYISDLYRCTKTYYLEIIVYHDCFLITHIRFDKENSCLCKTKPLTTRKVVAIDTRRLGTRYMAALFFILELYNLIQRCYKDSFTTCIVFVAVCWNITTFTDMTSKGIYNYN